MLEVFKDCKFLENLYEVSNLGRVRRKQRYVNSRYGRKALKSEKMIKIHDNGAGYKYVTLRINTEKKNYLVHRLVAETFIIKIPGLTIVNHLDGDRTNNTEANLEWGTSKSNFDHAVNTLKTINVRGESSNFAKITAKEADEIKDCIEAGETNPYIARKYGLHRNTIRLIRLGKTWKD